MVTAMGGMNVMIPYDNEKSWINYWTMAPFTIYMTFLACALTGLFFYLCTPE